MPTLVTHSFLALTFGRVFSSRRLIVRFWILAVACSNLPDIDVAGFWFGVRYGDPFGHRGFTHSIVFAVMAGAAAVLASADLFKSANERLKAFLFFAAVTASHGVLDAMTDGGLGVAFLAPFTNERYFFPFRPMAVSPIGIDLFLGPRGAVVLLSEFVWVWIPVAGVLAGVAKWRSLRAGRLIER